MISTQSIFNQYSKNFPKSNRYQINTRTKNKVSESQRCHTYVATVADLNRLILDTIGTTQMIKYIYYASPSSGDAYCDRQLTPNFEL